MLKMDLIEDKNLIVRINYANLDKVDFRWNLVLLDLAELKWNVLFGWALLPSSYWFYDKWL